MKDGEILLIDKPKGITSFDVIRILRKKIGVRKMGHAGTLDPLASGLMLVGIGSGTKKLKDLIGLTKEYEADILLGRKTTTGDMEGDTIEQKQVSKIEDLEIEKVLKAMIGNLELPVPAYSAIKRGGEALYKKARRGEEVDVPMKTMGVIKAEFLGGLQEEDYYIIKVIFKVTSGTYVRSLAEDAGNRLGVPATIKELRRTKVGEYDIKDAIKL